MPEAEPFTALGRGNGYTFCFKEIQTPIVDGKLPVSISDYNNTYGVTFSTGTFFSNPLSDQYAAMQLFWNLHSFKVNIATSFTFGSDPFTSNLTSGLVEPRIQKTPIERICGLQDTYREPENEEYSALPEDKKYSALFKPSGILFYEENGEREYYVKFSNFIFDPKTITSATGFITGTQRELDRPTFTQVLDRGTVNLLGVEIPWIGVYGGTAEPNDGSASFNIDETEVYTY